MSNEVTAETIKEIIKRLDDLQEQLNQMADVVGIEGDVKNSRFWYLWHTLTNWMMVQSYWPHPY